ncbi:DNA alkylation repair protein [Rhodococcus tibetensis]|uniref:DNA alkylation repair protein n=1 Tax=Rhodococcus tibetensis TaxID=2965064 RepID=UPI0035AC19D1
MTSTSGDVIRALAELADEKVAAGSARFFKTGPGQYGEGDVFIGVRVPATRGVVRRHGDLELSEVEILLDSPVHEHRLAGLLVLVSRCTAAARAGDDAMVEKVARFYLDRVLRGRVNNWDLVDASADHILGTWLVNTPRDLIFRLAADDDLWRRRVALLSTFAFIRRADASTTLEVAQQVLGDRRDLTQKAMGWMLREVGKRVDRALLTGFLDRNAAHMGRTALSYACEHLTAEERAAYRAQR